MMFFFNLIVFSPKTLYIGSHTRKKTFHILTFREVFGTKKFLTKLILFYFKTIYNCIILFNVDI